MSDPKTQISARIHESSKDTLDEYAERSNLNRSQAIEKLTEQWAEADEEAFVDQAQAARRDNLLIASVLALLSSIGSLPLVGETLLLVVAGGFMALALVGYFGPPVRSLIENVSSGSDEVEELASDETQSSAAIDSRVRQLGGLLTGLALLAVAITAVLGGGI